MDNFSLEILGTTAGCVLFVEVVTQLLKEKLKKCPTQFLSYILSAGCLIFKTLVLESGTIDGWREWSMVLANAVFISLASNGGYSLIQRMSPGEETYIPKH
ncbi:MAG: hypothetical protein FWE80_03240 [Oscillospiraceae bacterium]|nr:hypothetical protein [Oscillospiraceae bacterium]